MRQERNDKIGKGIEEDIDAAARTHLKNQVTTEEEILTLDKNCEYCQIYPRIRKALTNRKLP
jgi:hypothetical protein